MNPQINPDEPILSELQDKTVFIKKSEMKRMNDPKCEHDLQKEDDETDAYTAYKCTHCPVGRLVKR